MHYKFAEVVDPVIVYVLNLLSRISKTNTDSGEPYPSGELERDLIKKQFSQADQRAARLEGYSDQWSLAKYALTVWTDEMLINAPWPSSSDFKGVPLQLDLFKRVDGGTGFFSEAQNARKLVPLDALEVFYLAVALGFKGLYGEPNVEQRVTMLNLPPTLGEWAEKMSQLVKPEWSDTDQDAERRVLGPCDPLTNGRFVLGGILLCIILGAIAAIIWWSGRESTNPSEELSVALLEANHR